METLELAAPEVDKQPVKTEQLSGSQIVMQALLAEGTKTIFGYPGGAIMPIYDALYDYQDRIEHILVRHGLFLPA